MGHFLHTELLVTGYPGKTVKVISENLNLQLRSSEVICLLAPNGSGKTTLVKTLSGFLTPLGGKIFLEGKEITQISPAKKARMLSVVLTERFQSSNMSVYSLVSLGRSPYTGWWGAFSRRDHHEVKSAISEMHLEPLQSRALSTLSDGERQKAMIARALAQDTPLIMLDEPTAHLDLPNRVDIMKRLKRLAHIRKKAVLITTHDLDLALQTADRLWLIMPDGSVVDGVPEDLILNGMFEHAFQFDQATFDRSSGRFLVTDANCGKIAVPGASEAEFWARKALQRIGLRTSEINSETVLKYDSDKGQYVITKNQKSWKASSIEKLISIILREELWDPI